MIIFTHKNTLKNIRYFKKREDLRCELREEPCNDSVGNRCAVDIPPLQLGEDVPWIHSARLDEALVTAAILRVST